jgi:hypothetical protein
MILEIGISSGSPVTELFWQLAIIVSSCKVKCLGIKRDTSMYFFTRLKPVTESGTNVAPLLKSGNGGFLKLFSSYGHVSATLSVPNKV